MMANIVASNATHNDVEFTIKKMLGYEILGQIETDCGIR